VKSLGFFKHTQRHKAANFIFILFIFCGENPLKSPPVKTYMVKRAFWKISKKKTKSPHFEEKKNRFEITEICEGFGQIPSFLLLKCVYEGRANPNPLTPKEDDRTNRHLKYYI
jgi:hypothetical protein